MATRARLCGFNDLGEKCRGRISLLIALKGLRATAPTAQLLNSILKELTESIKAEEAAFPYPCGSATVLHPSEMTEAAYAYAYAEGPPLEPPLALVAQLDSGMQGKFLRRSATALRLTQQQAPPPVGLQQQPLQQNGPPSSTPMMSQSFQQQFAYMMGYQNAMQISPQPCSTSPTSLQVNGTPQSQPALGGQNHPALPAPPALGGQNHPALPAVPPKTASGADPNNPGPGTDDQGKAAADPDSIIHMMKNGLKASKKTRIVGKVKPAFTKMQQLREAAKNEARAPQPRIVCKRPAARIATPVAQPPLRGPPTRKPPDTALHNTKRLVHSRAYHKTLTIMRRRGLSDKVAKLRARAAGKAASATVS